MKLKTIKDYLHYLLKNPFKLILLILLNAFCFIVGTLTFTQIEYNEYQVLVTVLLSLLVTAIFIAVNLQPYKEWTDGRGRDIRNNPKV